MGQSTTDWNAYGGGGAGLGTGADFAIQSTLAVDKQITNADKGMMHSDAGVSLGPNDHIIGWIFAATPGILDTLANGGKVMAIGTSTSDFNKYALEGSDTRPEGGNKPYAVRYSTATPSPGSQVGTPGATPSFFGGGLNTVATAKGANLGLDAFRYGSGAFITAGEIANPATFAGFATQDEAALNKWGLLFRSNGVYQWQGRFVVGQNNAGTPTLAYFDDASGAVITILDTLHSQTDFTQLIIDHASTVFNLSGATFISLGTNNPGIIVINNASATSTGFDTCTFRRMGTIQGHVNVPYTSCSFILTDQITQNSGDFTSCVFDRVTATAALLSNDPSKLDSNSFISDGTGHAIEITTPGTYAFSGNKFTGYSGTGTNAAVYNNSGGLVTLNISGGGDTPTVRNGAGASTSVVNAVVLTITSKDAANSAAIEGARVYLEAASGGPATVGDVIMTGLTNASGVLENSGFAFLGDQPVVGRVRKSSSSVFYKTAPLSGTITANGLSITAFQVRDQ